jgi:hypothetical protein
MHTLIVPQLNDEAWLKAIDDEVHELLSSINTNELLQAARTLNGGKSCVFRLGNHVGAGAMMGCANYHAWVDFDDGEKWLVRIPRAGFTDIPASLVEYFISSEYATLKFLETTKIPAPKAFGFGLSSDPANLVGVNYLFIEALPGKPYNPHIATVEQRKFVFRQTADILVEISQYTFGKAGSLSIKDSSILVGELASNRFLTLGQSGPFNTDVEYFAVIIDQHLSLIADGQLYHSYPKEAFLFYKLWGQNIAKLCANETGDTFFLKHVDDKGDHLLVDEEYKIVGIIDWQFARTVPAREAFGPSLLTANLQNLYSRNTGVTDDDREISWALQEQGQEDLGKYAIENELVRRFHIGLASELSRKEVGEMIAGVLTALGQDMDVDIWISQEWSKCQDDPRFAQIEALILDQSCEDTNQG